MMMVMMVVMMVVVIFVVMVRSIGIVEKCPHPI